MGTGYPFYLQKAFLKKITRMVDNESQSGIIEIDIHSHCPLFYEIEAWQFNYKKASL